MIGRVATFQVQPGKLDEVVGLAKKALAVMEEQKVKGYKGYLALVDRQANKYVGLQLWETEADATAFATGSLNKELMAPLVGLIAGPPTSEVYEVAIQV